MRERDARSAPEADGAASGVAASNGGGTPVCGSGRPPNSPADQSPAAPSAPASPGGAGATAAQGSGPDSGAAGGAPGGLPAAAAPGAGRSGAPAEPAGRGDVVDLGGVDLAQQERILRDIQARGGARGADAAGAAGAGGNPKRGGDPLGGGSGGGKRGRGRGRGAAGDARQLTIASMFARAAPP